ncbi:MAG TPA: hypothetical protein VMW75_23390, partial [Thermoanaerobaculia bacterium]|nr:hypothetical protein [Thermoanaerobaculia bacterium]
MGDPLAAYAQQLYGPAPSADAPSSPDPLDAYAAQLYAKPGAGAAAMIAAHGGRPPDIGATPPTGALQDLLDLAKMTGANAWAAVGAPAANLMMQVGAPPGPGVNAATANPAAVAAVGPQALQAMAARGVPQAQQQAQEATSQYLAGDPNSPLRVAAAAAGTAAGQLGPTVAAPFAGAEAAGAAAAARYAGLAETSPTVYRLLVTGAKLAGAGAEGVGYGYANADPTKPLADQLPDIARQAAISAATVGTGEALRGAGALLRGAGAPEWLAGKATTASPPAPDAPAGPPAASPPDSVAPVEPRLGYSIEDRSAPGSAARTLAAVGPDGSAELDYHRAAGGGFHPTDLRLPPEAPPDAARALYQAASEIEGPHRGDFWAPGGDADRWRTTTALRASDPDVFGDYRGDPANRPPPLTSEELAAFTPSTSGAVESPANAELVRAIGERSARPFDPARYIEPTPLRVTTHEPLPLPPLGPGLRSEDVADAWATVSARYPGIARFVPEIRLTADMPDNWLMRAVTRAETDPATGTLYVSPGRVDAADLFHELTHVAQGVRTGDVLMGNRAEPPETVFPERMGLRDPTAAAAQLDELPAYRRGFAAMTPAQRFLYGALDPGIGSPPAPFRVYYDGSVPDLGVPPLGSYRKVFPTPEAPPRGSWPADAPPPVDRPFPTWRDPAELAETRAAIPMRTPTADEVSARMRERGAGPTSIAPRALANGWTVQLGDRGDRDHPGAGYAWWTLADPSGVPAYRLYSQIQDGTAFDLRLDRIGDAGLHKQLVSWISGGRGEEGALQAP